MCGNYSTSEILLTIVGWTVWIFAFIGVGSLYKVAPQRSVIYGVGTLFALALLYAMVPGPDPIN